jgi:hypothetical protein
VRIDTSLAARAGTAVATVVLGGASSAASKTSAACFASTAIFTSVSHEWKSTKPPERAGDARTPLPP